MDHPPSAAMGHSKHGYHYRMLLARGSSALILPASFAKVWLLLAALCVFLHWVTDNLDGELARTRQLVSERGFFLDLLCDNIGGISLGTGFYFATYTFTPLVFAAMIIFLMETNLSLFHIILRQRFQLGRIGPAEGRAFLIILAVLTFFWNGSIVTIAGRPCGWFDIAVMVILPIGVLEWLVTVVKLYHELTPARRT
jgi:phosphatidylglycerophosphate synthase